MMGLLLDNKSINKATGVHLQSLWKLKKLHSDGFRISQTEQQPERGGRGGGSQPITWHNYCQKLCVAMKEIEPGGGDGGWIFH